MSLLESYLKLERQLYGLDQESDLEADALADLMDSIWYAMSDEDHALLNAREGKPESFVGRISGRGG